MHIVRYSLIRADATDLCVLDAEHPRGEREGNQGRRKEHLQARDIAFPGLGLLIKRVGSVDAVAFGCA